MARDPHDRLYASPAGRAALRVETSVWRQYVAAVDQVLEPVRV